MLDAEDWSWKELDSLPAAQEWEAGRPPHLYHLITSSRTFMAHGTLWTDYDEFTKDEKVDEVRRLALLNTNGQ